MSGWNFPIFNIKKAIEKEETTVEGGYYSAREVADVCEMTVQKTSAMLTQLYYEGKVERAERKVKRYGNNSVHIRVFRSREFESIEELVKRKALEYDNTPRRRPTKIKEVPFAPIICNCCGAPVNSKTYICDYCGTHYVKASSL